LDVPEAHIQAIENLLTHGAPLTLGQVGDLTSSMTEQQFVALSQWRLPELKPLMKHYKDLAALKGLSEEELRQAETAEGLPLASAPALVRNWITERLDERPSYPAWQREAWLNALLQQGKLRVKYEIPSATEAERKIRLTATAPKGETVEIQFSLPLSKNQKKRDVNGVDSSVDALPHHKSHPLQIN
jgi:hypothetical protein